MDLFLTLAIVAIVIAIILAVFGFRGGASQMAGIAKLCFVIFLVLAIVFFIMRMVA